MARPRSPNRDRALHLWLTSGKRRLLKDIADELEVSEEQIRKWKNQDKWDKVTLPNANSNVTNHKGGQPGNQNAVGHGGTGPPGNKNAVKTGEFETLFFNTLSRHEQRLMETTPKDKGNLLLQEIQLLTVREHRMLQRIQSLEKAADNEKDEKTKGMLAVKCKKGENDYGPIMETEFTGILGQIQSVEDALTRVQARKQKAIDSLHRFGFDDARLEIELMKLDIAILKVDNQDQETEDDGFLAAMDAEASNLWSDMDGD